MGAIPVQTIFAVEFSDLRRALGLVPTASLLVTRASLVLASSNALATSSDALVTSSDHGTYSAGILEHSVLGIFLIDRSADWGVKGVNGDRCFQHHTNAKKPHESQDIVDS